MSVFARKKSFYFVGIGGIGMSGLAEILLNMGHDVAGSDRQLTEITQYLAERGAKIFEGHAAQNLQKADFVIYSSAIPDDNPELQKARKMGIPCLKRAALLGQIFNRKTGVAVAGTHGKTTTTSMIGKILIDAQKDPTIIVGGRLYNLMTNARLGKGEVVVTEADEYDRSFLTLFPRLAVITNLEADHLDIYRDLDDLKDTFVQFANQVTFDGAVICCGDDANLQQIVPKIGNTVITYGFGEQNEYQARNVTMEAGASRFDLYHNEQKITEFTLNVPGRHNVLNALGATVAALELEIEPQTIARSLADFGGVERRFDVLTTAGNVTVVDDYAHHPTEIKATLQAARDGWNKRLIAVFQPHLYSRTRDFYKDFAEALKLADVVFVQRIYPAREEPLPGITGALIANQIPDKAQYIGNDDELFSTVLNTVQPGDMVLFLGAGDIHYLALRFAKKLEEGA